MKVNLLTRLFLLVTLTPTVSAGHWPQAAGPNANWKIEGPEPPLRWSVARGENVRWRTTLPEGGQSAVTVWGNRAFVTTHRPMEESGDRREPDLVGYCLDADTGTILWSVDLPGTDPVMTAGIFSDATVFAPIADGTRVWFFNRCGSMGCFDFGGKPVWLREFRPRTRHTNRQCEPVLVGDLILTVEVRDKDSAAKLQRHQPVPEGVEPRDVWTYLHAIDKDTGEVRWIGESGTSVHNTPVIGTLADGRRAVVHGRGGGHGPLEKPYGVSLTLLENGKTLWSREIPGGCAFNSHWNEKHVFWFTGTDHLVLDAATGEISRRQPLFEKVSYTDRTGGESPAWVRRDNISLEAGRKLPNTYHTNITAGEWHYFLAHDFPAVGRVNVETGKTEYLRLPVMILPGDTGRDADEWLWEAKDVAPNDTRNSRDIDIAPDRRAKRTGWGHVSAASPILVNRHLFFPMMNGTVYVIDALAEKLDEKALVAVNDLGPAGETWTLASFSYAGGRLYMHTMKEVICLE